MNAKDIEETIKRYSERLKKLGHSPEALGWTRSNNEVRFKALLREWGNELSGKRICDFGCGFGDLYRYLVDLNNGIHYTGIDINSELVEVGKSLYPNAEFWIGDILNDPTSFEFDFTFSSGVFNHKLSAGQEYNFIERAIEKIDSFSEMGFAVNFLSDKVEYLTEHNFNSNPGKILEICYKYSNNVVLRNDYMPFEFTVFVRKDKEVDREKLIYV